MFYVVPQMVSPYLLSHKVLETEFLSFLKYQIPCFVLLYLQSTFFLRKENRLEFAQ